jgi:hypothetical protein
MSMLKWIGICALAAVSLVFVVGQTVAPTLSPLFAGASVVAGKAAQGSAPIVIYDLSYDEKTRIGVASTIAQDGTFSSPVRPSLIMGHQIVAVDNSGNASVPVTVN